MLELMKYPNVHIILKISIYLLDYFHCYWLFYRLYCSDDVLILLQVRHFNFFLGPEAQHCIYLLQGPTVPLESLVWWIIAKQKPIVLVRFEIKSVWKPSHLWSFQSLDSSFFMLIWTCVLVSFTCTKSLKDMDWLLLMFACLVVGAQ